MATEQLLFGSVSIGSIFTDTIGANQFIRLNGNTTSGSPNITNVADNGVSYFGVSELRVDKQFGVHLLGYDFEVGQVKGLS